MGGDVSVQAQDKTLVLCGWDARNTCSTYCNCCGCVLDFLLIESKKLIDFFIFMMYDL